MSTESVRARILESGESGTPLRISGKGGWISAGRPSNATEILSLADDAGIVSYTPDDLTITVRAGTTLGEIQRATRPNNQWLPLDPFGGDDGTIGATIATASSGPLSHSYGTARDFILGVEFITGRADVVRAGGRVVKNVAGFDLMRLLCGSWGTLGVITEVTLRLYALPKMEHTLVITVPPGKLEELTASLRSAPIAPIAMELVSAGAAKAIGLPESDAIIVRIAGNDAVVESQTRALGAVAPVNDAAPEVWMKLRQLDAGSKISLRAGGLPTDLPSIWEAGRNALAGKSGAWMHSTFSRGVARMVSSDETPPIHDCVRQFASAGRPVYESLPYQMWAEISPTVVSDRLSRGVKNAYDPRNILNPGILGD